MILTRVGRTLAVAALAASTLLAGAGAAGAQSASTSSAAALSGVASSGAASYIVGGRPALRTYPFMGSLEFSTAEIAPRHGCGVSLITNQWVVTARHCVDEYRDEPRVTMAVRFGGNRWADMTRYEIDRSSIVWVPEFGPEPGLSGDIALIKLAKPVPYEPVRIGRVPATPALVRIIGWGATNPKPTASAAVILRELDTKLLSLDTCKLVDRGDLCVDDPDRPWTSACYGDSGGPLLAFQKGEWRLIGATSRDGMSNGATCYGSTVYTSVPYFRKWIEKQIGAPLP